MFLQLNGVLNPLLNFGRNKDMRKGLRKLLKRSQQVLSVGQLQSEPLNKISNNNNNNNKNRNNNNKKNDDDVTDNKNVEEIQSRGNSKCNQKS